MSILKKHSRHFSHYLTLFGIFFFGVIGFWIFSYDRMFQSSIALAIAVSYVAWGIVHHFIHRDFHWKVVIEYLSIASIGLIIILSLVFQS